MAGVIQPIQSDGDQRVGEQIESLDTPTLLLDLEACQANLRRMAEFFADRPAGLRPHFKNHKCVSLARRQLAAGAVGMTCAKLGEAEVLADHGFDDILVANQIVGQAKVARLVRLAGRCQITVAVDHAEQAEAISAAAEAGGVCVGVLVEVDIGMGRCGVAPGQPALSLAGEISKLPGLRLRGLQAFEGHLVNQLDRQRRRQLATAAMQLAIDTRRKIEASGLPVELLSGCSTATYDITGVMPGVDEVQAGSYVTMDCQYQRLIPEFDIALTVLARVISRPAPDRAVLDVGVKGAGGEFGVPQIADWPDVEIPRFLSEEHLVVRRCPNWAIGQAVRLVPSHACTTCNLHREIVVHQQGRVVDVWPIEAAGKLR